MSKLSAKTASTAAPAKEKELLARPEQKGSSGSTKACTKSCTKGRPRTFDREEALQKALRIFWELGYEPASVAAICKAIGINPPSFYAAFGSKETLFLEAVRYYEKTYWTGLLTEFEESRLPIAQALRIFFEKAAAVLLNPATPNGCMVVLAAVNISPKETQILALVKDLRRATRDFFARRLARAVREGELASSLDIEGLADMLNIFLEGMSIQARDGLALTSLAKAADPVIALFESLAQKSTAQKHST